MKANLKQTLAVGSCAAMVLSILTLVILTLNSCGGDGSNGHGYFDQNGVCVENCGGNGDASMTPEDGYIYPPADICNTCLPQPQYDATIGACEAIKAGKKPPEVCMPKEAKEGECMDYGIAGEPNCVEEGMSINCICGTGMTPGEKCSTDSDCQKVPCESWPPEVCWEFCGFLGEWDCPSSVWTIVYLPDEGDGLCHMENSNGLNKVLGKPGDLNPRFPINGTPNISYALSPDGQTLTELTSMVTCSKM
ncbi:MAG: hypothetical protein AAB666_01785 [Patescibacteria group bacterium]